MRVFITRIVDAQLNADAGHVCDVQRDYQLQGDPVCLDPVFFDCPSSLVMDSRGHWNGL